MTQSPSSAVTARSASAFRCSSPADAATDWSGLGPGVPVVIGSRDAGRAQESAGKLRERLPDAQVEGLTNEEAAAKGEIVLLCVPFRNQSENLTNLKNVLREGQILVDATVPLAAAVGGRATRLLGVPQGSAAQQAQEMAP